MDIEKLEKLNELKTKGILSEEEFQTEKEKLLNGQTHPVSYEEPPMVPFKEAYKRYWIRSFIWKGRASRAEYWWPALGNFLIATLFGFISSFIGFFEVLGSLFYIVTLVPSYAVLVRRVHDINKSTYFAISPLILCAFLFLCSFIRALARYTETLNESVNFIISLIFIIGGFTLVVLGIMLLVFSLLPGTKGDNKYGPQPE